MRSARRPARLTDIPLATSGRIVRRVPERERQHDGEDDRWQIGPAERGRDDQAEDLADRAAGQAVDRRLEGEAVDRGRVVVRVVHVSNLAASSRRPVEA